MSSRKLVGREGYVAAWAPAVEMLLTWPIWVPQGMEINEIFCLDQSVPTSSALPPAAGHLQGLTG